MLDKTYYDKADEVIAVYGRKPASLIPIMQDIQAEYRYLPGELLNYVGYFLALQVYNCEVCIFLSCFLFYFLYNFSKQVGKFNLTIVFYYKKCTKKV